MASPAVILTCDWAIVKPLIGQKNVSFWLVSSYLNISAPQKSRKLCDGRIRNPREKNKS